MGKLEKEVLNYVVRQQCLITTASSTYKHLIMTSLLAETGNPSERELEKVAELKDMGEWDNNVDENTSESRPRNQDSKFNTNRLSWKEKFDALINAGVAWEKLDGIPTKICIKKRQKKQRR